MVRSTNSSICESVLRLHRNGRAKRLSLGDRMERSEKARLGLNYRDKPGRRGELVKVKRVESE